MPSNGSIPIVMGVHLTAVVMATAGGGAAISAVSERWSLPGAVVELRRSPGRSGQLHRSVASLDGECSTVSIPAEADLYGGPCPGFGGSSKLLSTFGCVFSNAGTSERPRTASGNVNEVCA